MTLWGDAINAILAATQADALSTQKVVTDATNLQGIVSNLVDRVARLEQLVEQFIVPPSAGGIILLNRDLSSGDLSQWTHRDYGVGTDVGSNSSGAGLLIYHSDVLGRRAAGLTVTPTAHASPAATSDSVYLWEPAQPTIWGMLASDVWLRTSLFFPSPASAALFTTGEAAYQPVTGDWNWILELHNDHAYAGELANVAIDVFTDYPAVAGQVGQNPRLSMRIMGGQDSAIHTTRQDAPPLIFDHWYDLLLHIRFDPIGGVVEWFLDGNAIFSNQRIPTLYTRLAPAPSPSYTNLTIANYRWHAPWSATYYLGPLVVGTTRAVVMGAF